MAPGAPTRPLTQELGVFYGPDVYAAAALVLHLCMALQAEIGIALHEQLAVNRSMRVMAHGAAFSHRLMLENKRPGLLAMTIGARFVQPRHGEAACAFENVSPMRIMALHAVHALLDYWMMLRQLKFRVRFQMALKAS